jgi:hypothetical protein
MNGVLAIRLGSIYEQVLLIEDNVFAAALMHNKTYELKFDDLSHEVLEYFLES